MPNIHRRSGISLTALSAALFAGTTGAAAAESCVNPQGNKGCYSSINAAIAAAAPGDTVRVGQGTYREQVIIPKPLALIGFNAANTIVDASSNANGVGIYVDGMDNPGLSEVVVQGFTVTNGKYEGNPGHQFVQCHDHREPRDRQQHDARCSKPSVQRSA